MADAEGSRLMVVRGFLSGSSWKCRTFVMPISGGTDDGSYASRASVRNFVIGFRTGLRRIIVAEIQELPGRKSLCARRRCWLDPRQIALVSSIIGIKGC